MNFPYNCVEIEKVSKEFLKEEFPGLPGFYQVSPKKYLLLGTYQEVAASIYNLEVRPDDIWVLTYPRSGTTIIQEMVWLLANDMDFETAKKKSLNSRFPFIDFSFILPEQARDVLAKTYDCTKEWHEQDHALYVTPEIVATQKSPRFIKTHLPFSLLPPSLIDSSKCICVVRNPKDVAVSYYYQQRLFNYLKKDSDFATFWDIFQRGLIYPGPFWEHIRESWSARDHPNLLFLFYEDVVNDLKASCTKVAKFLDKTLTDTQLESLLEHLKIENFRKNPSVNMEMDMKGAVAVVEDGNSFIRQGKNHGWTAEFSTDMNIEADKWVQENLSLMPGFAFP